MEESVRQYLSGIGRLGGSKVTLKKIKAAIKNGQNVQPHFEKLKYFIKKYPYKLENNEWRFKVQLPVKTKTGRIKTYNPDYYCPTTKNWIEVATSKSNISEQNKIWKMALKIVPLKIYWWDGKEITKKILTY